MSIKEPKQSLAKERFKHSCGQKKIDCFFGIKIKDVRLIGPYGIVYQKGTNYTRAHFKVLVESCYDNNNNSTWIIWFPKRISISFISYF